MSLPFDSHNDSSSAALILIFSCLTTVLKSVLAMLLRTGRLKRISKQAFASGRSRGVVRSFAIQIIGNEQVLITRASSPIPPRSPLLIPSTSSITTTRCLPIQAALEASSNQRRTAL